MELVVSSSVWGEGRRTVAGIVKQCQNLLQCQVKLGGESLLAIQRPSIPYPAQYALCSNFWLPSCPTFNEVEATFVNIFGSAPPVAKSSLQMVYRTLVTHHQAIAIYESDQTSWLIWHRGLGEESVLAVDMEMLKYYEAFVPPACNYAVDSI